MQKTFLFIALGGAVLLCGCNRQAKVNSQKLDALSARLDRLEQTQSRQMELVQAELQALSPEVEKVSSTYFEKNRDEALFFHTNTLYLLLTVGKQIESQLQLADEERRAEDMRAHHERTNQLDTTLLCAAHIEDTMSAQTKQIEDSINAETRRLNTALSNSLVQQIRSVAAPDAAEIARRRQLSAALAQIQRDLDSIKAQLAATNPPAR
jgi:outer membrane murein-binding lipoprotein Lpp